MQLFPTREDAEKYLISESEDTWPEVEVLDINGEKVQFSKVKYVIVSARKVADVEQEHKIFNNKVISLGKYQEADGTQYDFTTTQDPDTRKVHFNWVKK